MKHNIQISVLGIQNAGDEPEAILTKATGTYHFEKGVHKINYCELDENGTATDNLLLLSGSEMRLSKSGSVAGRFLFVLGCKTVADYLTPFGKIDFEVETESYHLDVKENNLNVQLKYRLYADNQLFSENTLTIQTFEDKKDGFGFINKARRNHL